MIRQTESARGKCPAAAHAPSVDDTADSEPHDSNNQPQDEQEECSHDANSNPSQTTNQKTNWSHGSTSWCEQTNHGNQCFTTYFRVNISVSSTDKGPLCSKWHEV